jgi:hypothetical protein
MRSWFWFQIWPSPWFSTLALEAVSRKLTRVMTSVGSSNCPRVCQSGQARQVQRGQTRGQCAPTTLPPEASKPAQALMAVIPATMNNTDGKGGPPAARQHQQREADQSKGLRSGVPVGRGKPLLPAGLDTQHGWQLRCNDQQRCRLREPHQHRGTDEVEQPAKTHEAEYDLQRAR